MDVSELGRDDRQLWSKTQDRLGHDATAVWLKADGM